MVAFGSATRAKVINMGKIKVATTSQRDLVRLIRHPAQDSKWECALCGGSFNTSKALTTHGLCHDKNGQRPCFMKPPTSSLQLACDMCDFQTETKLLLQMHRNFDHVSD